jgi:hypothetical protein
MKTFLTLAFLFLTQITSAQTLDLKTFNLSGHFKMYTDAPEPLSMVLFEGPLTLLEGPVAEQYKKALQAQNVVLQSEIYISITAPESPQFMVFIFDFENSTFLNVLDFKSKQNYKYQISEVRDGKLVSKDPHYSDYLVEVTPAPVP